MAFYGASRGLFRLVAFAEEQARVPGTDDSFGRFSRGFSPNLAGFGAKVSSSFRTTLSILTFGATGEIIRRATVNAVIERPVSWSPGWARC